MKNKTSIISGCFDAPPDSCPHLGHLHILQQMRDKVGPEGKVIVALNPDSYILEKKGRAPLSNFYQRYCALFNTKLVDIVYISDDGLYNLIKELAVDYIFVGDDWPLDKVVGRELAEVIITPRIPNISTSQIIRNIENSRSMTNEEKVTANDFYQKHFSHE